MLSETMLRKVISIFVLKEKQLIIFLLEQIGAVLSSIFAVVVCKRENIKHVQSNAFTHSTYILHVKCWCFSFIGFFSFFRSLFTIEASFLNISSIYFWSGFAFLFNLIFCSTLRGFPSLSFVITTGLYFVFPLF